MTQTISASATAAAMDHITDCIAATESSDVCLPFTNCMSEMLSSPLSNGSMIGSSADTFNAAASCTSPARSLSMTLEMTGLACCTSGCSLFTASCSLAKSLVRRNAVQLLLARSCPSAISLAASVGVMALAIARSSEISTPLL